MLLKIWNYFFLSELHGKYQYFRLTILVAQFFLMTISFPTKHTHFSQTHSQAHSPRSLINIEIMLQNIQVWVRLSRNQ